MNLLSACCLAIVGGLVSIKAPTALALGRIGRHHDQLDFSPGSYCSTVEDQCVQPSHDGNSTLVGKYGRLADGLTKFAWPQRSQAIQQSLAALRDLPMSAACREALHQLSHDLFSMRPWAIKALDASAKLNPGFLKGDFVDLASSPQCLSINRKSSLDMPTKYCTARLRWPLPNYQDRQDRIDLAGTSINGSWVEKISSGYKILYTETFTVGLCAPTICSSREIESALNNVAKQMKAPIEVSVGSRCISEDNVSHIVAHPVKKLAAAIVLSFVVITLASTIIVSLYPRMAPTYAHFFCARSNTGAIFKETTDLAAQRLSFLNGIRFIYLIMSLSGHWYFGVAVNSTVTHLGVVKETTSAHWLLRNVIYRMGGMTVGFNFVIGGLLCYYSWHPELSKRQGRLSFALFTIARFLRTTPVIAATVLLVLAFPANWGSGPNFAEVLHNVTTTCVNNAWRELLYISNSQDVMNVCLPHGWYMSADFQLYVMSFFVLTVLYKKPKLGFTMLATIVTIGFVLQAMIPVIFGTSPQWRMDTLDFYSVIHETHLLHFGTAMYISSYFMGIFLGYLIANQVMITTDPVMLIILKVISLSGIVASMGMSLICDDDNQSTLVEYMIAPVSRTLLSFSVGLLAYLCWLGEFQLVTKILSARIFARLGRFSFSTFMAHYLILWYQVGSMKSQLDFSVLSMSQNILATVMTSHLLGYLMFVVFEAPAFNVAKAIFTKGHRRKVSS